MFAQLTAGLDFQATALGLRAERQRVIASNIANSDTPGFVARDVNFKSAMAAAVGEQQLTGDRNPLQAAQPTAGTTHPAHMALVPGGGASAPGQLAYTVQTQAAMDNNTVDLDRERANFIDNAVRYESTLRFINGYSKTILSAIQGQ